MKRSCLAWLVLGSLAAPTALAYETPTHARMSQEAARMSVLPARLKDIAPDQKLFSLDSQLADGGSYLFGLISFQLQGSVSAWISHGAIEEDAFCCPALRFTNHFYNPLNGQGYSYLGVTGRPSLAWGTEPTDIPGQDYSFRDARRYLYDGITASTERQRKGNLTNMFRSMGQVIHLLQDLGQPQHTRNDSHATGSRYEQYTNLARGRLAYDGYPPVKVKTPDQFWVTPDRKGLADYTNAGFVTDGTNFTGTRSGNTINIRPDPNFPSPDGVGATIVKKQITDPDLLGPVGPNQPLIGEIWFVSTMVADNNQPGMNAANPRTSTFSIFDEDLAQYGFSWTFTQNRFNFDSAHTFLIPRAVGYSAGMLDYFFRGQMEITAPDDVVWAIVDPTQKDSFSQIKLKVRNATPEDSMAGGQLWAIAKYHLNTCYRSDLSGEAGGDNARDIVACRSRDESMAMSAPKTVTLPAGGAPQALSFDFGQSPIPVNATDLYIQLLYRGPLGSEADAVVVATKDVFEPTHVAFMNATDISEINDKYYTFDQVKAGIAAGDPTFAPIDLNQDKTYSPSGGDFNVNPIDFNNVSLSFVAPGQRVVATIPSLPAGRFVRIAFITDRSFVSFFPGTFGFSPPSAFNQTSEDDRTFFVTGVVKLRSNWVTDGDVIRFCIPGTTCNGDLTKMPDSGAPNATTPLQVTVTQQFP
jgi:hypothetical protein